jgi:2-polyprenyl-3-methyl-5-hydroxy-6-metoxy-1,4-benzoquinol methylase
METGDRISELYKGEIFAAEVQSTARQRIHWMCQEVEGRKIIDIGCSQGMVSILLAREGFQVVGVDTDSEGIEYADSDRDKEPPEVQERLTFIRSSIYDVDLPVREFHTAIMGEFLEHLDRPDRAITRAHEFLVDGGKLIITVPFGLFEHPHHKQTFYMASLYKLICPYFVISGVETIGRYLCLVCKKRKVVREKQVSNIDLALIERVEQEFLRREVALTRELDARKKEVKGCKAELDRERRTLQAVRASFSFRLGSMLVQAIHRPGRNTIFLPYRLIRVCYTEFRKRRTLAAKAL